MLFSQLRRLGNCMAEHRGLAGRTLCDSEWSWSRVSGSGWPWTGQGLNNEKPPGFELFKWQVEWRARAQRLRKRPSPIIPSSAIAAPLPSSLGGFAGSSSVLCTTTPSPKPLSVLASTTWTSSPRSAITSTTARTASSASGELSAVCSAASSTSSFVLISRGAIARSVRQPLPPGQRPRRSARRAPRRTTAARVRDLTSLLVDRSERDLV